MVKNTTETLFRLLESARFRINRVRGVPATNPAPLTFCIAHFNSPEFLDAALHAIRRFHPAARVMVADASSVWREYLAAREVCARYGAELHPLAGRHRHTGLLNYMFRRIRSRVAVFLDQDCVLLASLDPLIRLIESGKVLIGPRDEFTDHPSKPLRALSADDRGSVPQAAGICPCQPDGDGRAAGSRVVNQAVRLACRMGKASVGTLLRFDRIGQTQPAGWRADFGLGATGYGLGQVCFFNGSPVAYHQWFSGQVYGQTDKMENTLDADWLRDEMKRFLR